MSLVDREIRRLAVDRCGGGCNNLFYAVPNRGLENVERTADQNLNRFPGNVGAVSDSQCSLVENIIHSFTGSIDQRRIPDVALDHFRTASLKSGSHIVPGPTNEIVDYANFDRSSVKKLVNDGAPYKSGATGYQESGS